LPSERMRPAGGSAKREKGTCKKNWGSLAANSSLRATPDAIRAGPDGLSSPGILNPLLEGDIDRRPGGAG
jgi:hypothetical protein